MFRPRIICSPRDLTDPDGGKIYTISANGETVEPAPFVRRLVEVKQLREVPWDRTPHFTIFHQGESRPYLILAWWGNDNELFTSVSVQTGKEWVEQPDRYSFCLYDLEVFWAERNIFIETLYCRTPSLERYQMTRHPWSSDASDPAIR
ncbi:MULTISPECIES: hypothetical protein [Stenotrophomonas]|uniref:hypothetical protein n=1 Tax=Stenotrophomonas TaxID=40323 RepID=UPI000C26A02C|nr:hypothetical protein [Stenotrophomonas sp. 704A1]PJL16439.1 hypothetical protein B9Y66_04945 [Stenotrophomonas maltophilia]